MMSEAVRILIDEAVEIERELEDGKKKLEQLKARIQSHAFSEMQNKNLKYRRIYGMRGHANVTYKAKFMLNNFKRLYRAVGDIAKDHVKRTEEVKYDAKTAFKAALIAIADGDYGKEILIEDVLRGMGLEETHIKAAEKRLKGDYGKDKKVLESFGIEGDREEELDAIRRYRTAELVESFFGELTPLQLDEIKRSITVEQELAIGLEYEK
ncbi:ABC transporter permease [Paenibacillus lentus]|uniref:ABC transporter permease n=1 Tax=Paenibacillus lentus TaxID=1338368 RepID=UPI0036652AC1